MRRNAFSLLKNNTTQAFNNKPLICLSKQLSAQNLLPIPQQHRTLKKPNSLKPLTIKEDEEIELPGTLLNVQSFNQLRGQTPRHFPKNQDKNCKLERQITSLFLDVVDNGDEHDEESEKVAVNQLLTVFNNMLGENLEYFID